MSIESRLKSYHVLSPAEHKFIADMRQAATAEVGYGFMQQVIEWEWQDKGIGAWGPEYFASERKSLTDEIEQYRSVLRRVRDEQDWPDFTGAAFVLPGWYEAVCYAIGDETTKGTKS